MNDQLPDDVPLDEVTAPSDNELKSLVGLAREQWRLERLIDKLKADLAQAQEDLKNVAERELPNFMVEIGVTSFTLANGAELELIERVHATITEANRQAAHDWLEEHGHADLITREFKIRFNKDDESWAKKFRRDCNMRKKPLNLSEKRAVHAGTLGTWVREMLAGGHVIPEEVFGVYRQKYTKITPPKGGEPV